MGETEFDGWADLGAQRQAEDESLVQRYAAGEGRGQDMRPVRGFVQHVRRDIGPGGLILKVRMTRKGRGHEICVWYRLPGEKAERPQTASITDTPPANREARDPAPGDLAALARASAAVPPVPATASAPSRPASHPGSPAAGGSAASPG